MGTSSYSSSLFDALSHHHFGGCFNFHLHVEVRREEEGKREAGRKRKGSSLRLK